MKNSTTPLGHTPTISFNALTGNLSRYTAQAEAGTTFSVLYGEGDLQMPRLRLMPAREAEQMAAKTHAQVSKVLDAQAEMELPRAAENAITEGRVTLFLGEKGIPTYAVTPYGLPELALEVDHNRQRGKVPAAHNAQFA